jgi:carbonic anhydrase
MMNFTDEEFKAEVQRDTGVKPTWSTEAFSDLAENVQQSIARIAISPFVPYKESVRGFVFDVVSGRLEEVAAAVRR